MHFEVFSLDGSPRLSARQVRARARCSAASIDFTRRRRARVEGSALLEGQDIHAPDVDPVEAVVPGYDLRARPHRFP